MRRRLCGLILGAVLGSPALAGADVWCKAFAQCTYEGRPFRLRVVNASGEPLADVHALAEWIMYGFHGTAGPLMVQDAVSGPDGWLTFPAWGPIPGPRSGLVHGSDPIMTLFKPGYRTLLIQNQYPRGTEETTRVRVFGQDGQTFTLERFLGLPDEWVEELRRARSADPGGRSDEQLLRFRSAFLNRRRRLWAERHRIPHDSREGRNFFEALERDLQFLEEGR